MTAVIKFGKNFIISELNSRAEKTFGYKPDEIIGKPLGVLFHGDTNQIQNSIKKHFARKTPGKVSWTSGKEVLGLNKKGKKIPISVQISRKVSGRKQVFTAVINALSPKPEKSILNAGKNTKSDDLIAEVKKLKLQLKEEKGKVKELSTAINEIRNETETFFKSFPDLIFIVNYKGIILELRGGPEEELYISSQYFTGKNISTFLPKDIVTKFYSAAKKLTKKNNTISFEYSMPIRGMLMHFRGLMRYLTDEKIIFVTRNITQYEESKITLVKRDILLSAIAMAANALLSIKDPDKSVDKALEILGEAVTVNRVYIFKNYINDEGKVFTSQINEWSRNPAETQKDNPDLLNFDFDYIPRWKSLMTKGLPVNGLVKNFTAPEKEILEPQGIISLLAIPIFVEKNFWGFIGFDDTVSERIWVDSEIEILKSMAFIFALYIEQKNAEKDYIDKVNELTVLNQIIASSNKNDELLNIFKNVLDETLTLLHFDGGGIYLIDEDSSIAKLVCSTGISKEHNDELDNIDINNEIYRKVFIEGIPLFTENYKAANPVISKKFKVKSLASVPFYYNNKIIGAINVKSSFNSVFTNLQKELLKSISDELSGAVQRRKMYDSLVQNEANLNSFFNTIDDMLFVLDSAGNIIKINNAVQEKLKYSEEELYGLSVLTVHIPEGREVAKRIVGEMLAGITDSCFVPLITKYGERIKVETKIKLGKWNNHDVIFGISRDISHRLEIEDALKKSEERWKYALEGNGDGLWDWNLVTNEVYFSKNWKKMLGYEDDELENILDNWKSRIHPDDIDEVIPELDNYLKGLTESYSTEYRMKAKDGSYKWILDRGSIIDKGKDGKPLRMLGTHVDISFMKQIEQSLIENESRTRAMLDLLPDLIFVMTKDGTYIDYHAPSTAGLYVEPEVFLGRNLKTIFPKELADKFLELFEISANTGEMTFYEYFLHEKETGKRNYYEARILTYGEEDKVLTIIRDITSRKNSEKLLEESERKYRYLAEYSQDIVSLHSLDGTYEFVSSSIKTILGYEENELLGRMPSDIMHEEDAERFRKITPVEMYKSNPSNIYEIRYKHKKGGYVWLEVALAQIKDMDGKTIKILSASRDITMRKKAEEEITATFEKEKKLNELKLNFISTTSHEFRTPLAAILSSTELLEYYGSKWTDDKKQSHYNKIKVSVNNMTGLLNDVLTFNKSESGNVTFVRSETDMDKFCTDLIEEFKLRISPDFKVRYEYLSQKPLHNVDARLMKQALDNLLNNAAKYSGEGKNIDMIVEDESDGLTFYVYDIGIGILESDKDKLFEVFYRGKNAALIKGTGIGLPLVKRIAELHKGSISFESNVPKGTVFKLFVKTSNFA